MLFITMQYCQHKMPLMFYDSAVSYNALIMRDTRLMAYVIELDVVIMPTLS